MDDKLNNLEIPARIGSFYGKVRIVWGPGIDPNYLMFLRKFIAFRMASPPVTLEQLHQENLQLLKEMHNIMEEFYMKFEHLNDRLDKMEDELATLLHIQSGIVHTLEKLIGSLE